jgi:hypothetical protein
MQTSIKFFTNQRPESVSASETEASYNRGIIQINIPPFTDASSCSQTPTAAPSQSRQKIRVIMYGSIDCSGSMGEYASHYQSRQHHQSQQQKNTKMDFVHATLTNMVDTIISKQEEFSHVEFYLALVQFHSTATCVLHPMRVTPDSKDEILQVISRIRPLCGTNFEKCFKEMAHLISNESQHISPSADIPQHCVQRMHVFLTDGDNNEGNKHIPYLAGLLGATAAQPTQIMIGYGTDHDSATLQSLCSHFPNSRQWFIDDIEKTGCIFGEILWSSVNAAFTKVSISTPHAEVYDFETMQWKNEICLGDFAYDSSRTYYIRAPWQHDDLACKFTYTSIEAPQDTSCEIVTPMNYTSPSPSAETQKTKDAEVEKELWRLDTITTIDKSIQFFKTIRRMTFQDHVGIKTRLIDEITAFQEKFLKYATDNNLIEDPFIIQLADDLFVCINGLVVSSIGERYITARQASQIQQRAVTINDITPLQREIIDSTPIAEDEVPAISRTRGRTASFTPGNMASMMMLSPIDDDNVPAVCTPVSRARSAYVGCVDNDTTQAPPTPAADEATSTCVVSTDQEPKTPTPSDTPVDDNVLSETQEKMLSDLTPSSRGIGSNLRVMTRDAIVGMRKFKVRGHMHMQCNYGMDENGVPSYGGSAATSYDDDYMDSCGGDETFSSHASPGCARIGRMLSAPSQPRNPVTRTSTTPF